MRLRYLALAALFVVGAAADTSAAPPKKAEAKAGAKADPKAGKAAAKEADGAPRLDFPIQRATLDNGLRVVMNVDHASPTVAIDITYDVGSRDEEVGKSGFAHVFEHLMFGATKNLNEGEFESLVIGRGGFLSALTMADRTEYFMVVPENELALGLWLEAERMRSLDVSQASFEAERKIIEEEHRLRISNAPYGQAYYRINELAFQGCYAYAHPSPGSMDDLNRAELSWVRAFHAAHYGPNTAVLAISGDFDPDSAMSLVHRYFDNVPRIQTKPFAEPTLPEQTAERREVIEDKLARAPGISMGFVLPKPMTTEHDALQIASVLLGDGESSRFSKALLRESPVATTATAAVDTDYERGPGLFRIEARLTEAATVAEVEKRLDAELARLAKEPPSEAEMLRAKRRLQMKTTKRLAWIRDRAIDLAKYELFYGDPRQLARALSRIAAVTPEDVQKAAAKYLVKSRSSFIETRPKPTSQGPSAEVSR